MAIKLGASSVASPALATGYGPLSIDDFGQALAPLAFDPRFENLAVTIEVSRLLREHTGKRTTRYVAFACEEPPYFNLHAMGSQHHARQSRLRGDKIVGMLCLEMVGYYSSAKGSQAIPPAIPVWLRRFFPQRANFLAAVGNMKSCKLCWSFRRGFKRGARRMPLFSICLPEKKNSRNTPERQQFLLGSRLPGAHANRYELPAKSKLSPRNGHARHAGLLPHDRSHLGRRIGDEEVVGIVDEAVSPQRLTIQTDSRADSEPWHIDEALGFEASKRGALVATSAGQE